MSNNAIKSGNEVDMQKLLEKVPNRFILSIGVAKRSKQLAEGVRPLIDVEEGDRDYIKIALREIAEGKIKIVMDRIEEDIELIDEMDQLLESEIMEEQEQEEKKPVKEKNRPKSKSLAA